MRLLGNVLDDSLRRGPPVVTAFDFNRQVITVLETPILPQGDGADQLKDTCSKAAWHFVSLRAHDEHPMASDAATLQLEALMVNVLVRLNDCVSTNDVFLGYADVQRAPGHPWKPGALENQLLDGI